MFSLLSPQNGPAASGMLTSRHYRKDNRRVLRHYHCALYVLVAACGGGNAGNANSDTVGGGTYRFFAPAADINLTAVTAPPALPLVAVGAGGTIITESNGLLLKQVSGTTIDLTGVTWNSGMYYAVGDGTLLQSSDSITWTADPTASDKDELVAIANAGTATIAVSALGDVYAHAGTAWTDSPIIDVALTSGALWQSTFSVVGTDDTISPPQNGVIYSASISPMLGTFTSQANGLPAFVALASAGQSDLHYLAITAGAIYTSADGATFLSAYTDATATFTAVTCCDKRCFVVGHDVYYEPLVLRSNDAAHAQWQRDALPKSATGSLNSAACSGTALVATGTHGTILLSPSE